jgi:hypothetical protein
VVFEQATIAIDKGTEFEELKAVIDRAFQSGTVEEFLRQLSKNGLRVRDWDSILAKGILERFNQNSMKKTSGSLYEQLSMSDRAQIRESYLSRVEEVSPKLRTKFHRIYQYY